MQIDPNTVHIELRKAVPAGWVVRRADNDVLGWVIAKTELEPDEWPTQEYGVLLPKSLECLVFTYGNKDAGAGGIHHALLRSLTIDATGVQHFGIAACVGYVMSNYQPNEWGYT